MGNILRISDAASIGLHAMCVIARNSEESSSVKSMAEIMGISANHLSKVLQRLVKADLLTSIKGYNGGFFLAKEPKEISFLDIYEAIDGSFNPTNCLLHRSNNCGKCIMGGFVKSINKQARDYFSNTKLSDVLVDGDICI